MNIEYCSECDTPTGHGGRGEDSIYLEFKDREIGPLCSECQEQILAKMKELEGERHE